MSAFFHISTISDVHRLFGLEKPKHPLISVIRQWPEISFDFENTSLTSDLYLFSLKGNTRGSFKYGRNAYDFAEGTLAFIAPHQVASFADSTNELSDYGWTILFHPDLIKKSELGKTIKSYSFFDYATHEALHVSDKEKQVLADCVNRIETELDQNIDKHSQELIIINLGALMAYCHRYYDRQFYTRTNLNRDLLTKFEAYLEDYFTSDVLHEKGMPTVSDCGEALNMSGSYLSDLLRVETGKSAQAHIHSHLIEKAKMLLLGTDNSVSEVAYDLGFEYPQHFSKLFKSKTGLSPSAYRVIN